MNHYINKYYDTNTKYTPIFGNILLNKNQLKEQIHNDIKYLYSLLININNVIYKYIQSITNFELFYYIINFHYIRAHCPNPNSCKHNEIANKILKYYTDHANDIYNFSITNIEIKPKHPPNPKPTKILNTLEYMMQNTIFNMIQHNININDIVTNNKYSDNDILSFIKNNNINIDNLAIINCIYNNLHILINSPPNRGILVSYYNELKSMSNSIMMLVNSNITIQQNFNNLNKKYKKNKTFRYYAIKNDKLLNNIILKLHRTITDNNLLSFKPKKLLNNSNLINNNSQQNLKYAILLLYDNIITRANYLYGEKHISKIIPVHIIDDINFFFKQHV